MWSDVPGSADLAPRRRPRPQEFVIRNAQRERSPHLAHRSQLCVQPSAWTLLMAGAEGRPYSLVASSRYRQNAFAIPMCSGVLHSGSNNAGEHTNTVNAFAREVAT